MAAGPNIRQENKRLVYTYLYRSKEASIQETSSTLPISLPTVSTNISELLAQGLIRQIGQQESTGGRKASIYQCIEDARVAVGVEVFSDYIYMCLLNLYGTVICDKRIDISYGNEETYYSFAGSEIKSFIEGSGYKKEKILGVAIAMQGVVSPDHKRVVYGRILNNEGVSIESFRKTLDYPCSLFHDSESAAFAESFHRPSLRDASYILLNSNLGSGLILNREAYGGNHARGQLLEHIKLIPRGRLCYCGQKGCAEGYCSARSLEEKAGVKLPVFFEGLRAGDKAKKKIWTEYLTYLAMLINNVLMTIDVDIVIGGMVSLYMNESDMEELKRIIRKNCDFVISDRTVTLQCTGPNAAARGAALHYIWEFISNIN